MRFGRIEARVLIGLLSSAVVAGALSAGAGAEQASQPASAQAGRLDVGRYHACVLQLPSASVRCWGYGGLGALGYASRNTIGDDEAPATAGPVDLGAGRTASAIATGDVHSCALLDNKFVRCWGLGADGRLGNSSTENVGDDEAPRTVAPVDIGGTAKAISAGAGHTCAVLENGKVRCWGYGNSGALGYGNHESIGDNETPGSVEPVDLGAMRSATAISAGFDFTCALLDDGNVRCWGASGRNTQFSSMGNGRLGLPALNGDLGDDETPASQPTIELGGAATAITAGDNHACAILGATGGVRCWGLGVNGRLGYASTSNVGDDEAPGSVGPVELGGPAKAISAGGKHTCAILVSGSVRCWGSNRNGQLGYPSVDAVGDDETPASVGPVDLGPGRTAVAISAGQESTCARLDDGTVRCWGYGTFGRLGNCSPNTIGDNETPGSVGPVGIEPGPLTTGCSAGAASSTPPPTLTRSPGGYPLPALTDNGLAAQKRRARALRACLRGVARRARAQRRRGGGRRAKRNRRRCLKRYGRTPGRVRGLRARATDRDTIVLSFRAPGTDHGKPPAAHSYLVKQSRRPIRSARAFRRAQTLCEGSCFFPSATQVGDPMALSITGLRPGATYYYAVAARDNVSCRLGRRSRAVRARTPTRRKAPTGGHEHAGSGTPPPAGGVDTTDACRGGR